MTWLAITAPKDAGPSEREQILQLANDAFADAQVDSPTRVDVPGRGSGTSDEGVALRDQVHAIVPALQSGSLFGGANGLLVMDAQNLLKGEVDVIVEMLGHSDENQVVAVFASSGAMPAALKKAVADKGKAVSVKQTSSRDSNAWLVQYAKDQGLRIGGEARSELVKSFGGNIAAMRRQSGRPIAQFDAQIAAISCSRNSTLVTRNISDFEGCGIQLINPWEA